ncbi:hypothetical protein Q9R30_18020 [Arthrobacter sp. AB6]|uniref:IS1096 element passenger TnpR family protein n=1 Tax=Arthrobacter sp. AB6 TaxID=2962570 RepID=UPI0028828442|nr:hypothetical protein [Arthrobacter sp. AB6]MDT0197247.1 hypothetical protein [Arthrobacter sp. AB6]
MKTPSQGSGAACAFPAALTVEEFHLAVQAAFGWEDRHLYAVRCVDPRGNGRVVAGPRDATEGLEAETASAVVLSDLMDPRKPGRACEYEYDFGDGWTHQVELLGPAELACGELQCVGGANRCPMRIPAGRKDMPTWSASSRTGTIRKMAMPERHGGPCTDVQRP